MSSVLRVHWVSRGLQLVSSGSAGLIKLWEVKSAECNTTLDAHEDKVWALDVAESAAGGLEVWSGAADSTLARCRMERTRATCAEKVESDCTSDWSSPRGRRNLG